jgi:hypothetical protein
MLTAMEAWIAVDQMKNSPIGRDRH